MQLQSYQVRYFLALAGTLNFTRAAEQCNVTQPALTKAVQKLEQELGGTLIHRERHLTQLTELGKMILPTLEKIFAAAEAVRLQARGYQKKTIAPLKIGLVPSVSAALITELLLELARIIPDLRVDLREADASGLVAMLLDGEINAALVGDAVELPERIDHWLLFEERYVLVLSRKHPMARQTVIPPQDLHEAVFLERVGCDVAGRFKQACFADHPGPNVVHRSAQEGHLQQMASAGFGAILAPEHAPRLPSLTAIPIEGDPVRREVQLLRARWADRADDRLLQPPGELCLDQLAAVCAQQCLRHGRDAQRAQPAERACRPTEHRVVAHRSQEAGVIVVEREDPPQPLGRERRLRADRHGSVGRLPGSRELRLSLDRQQGREEAFAERARCVAREACGERE